MVLNTWADVAISLFAPTAGGPHAHPGTIAFTPVMIAVHVALVAFIAIECLAVLYFWLGRIWARWLILAGCIFYLMGLRMVRSQWHNSHLGAALTVFSAGLALFLIWYLHTSDVRDWFAEASAAASDKSPSPGCKSPPESGYKSAASSYK